MWITEAKIFNFGKLQNRTVSFAPGINVIYGPNEAGKSTLHDFLLAMLFGMEKGRGRAAAGDMYLRYEPWHAPAYYSGALKFQVEGKPFYLERNFYSKEKKELLRNMADGEELSVAYGDLAVLLGGIGREIFGNTYNIPQSGAATGKELSGILAEYLANAASGGDGSLRVNRAVSLLRSRKKEVVAEARKLAQEREAYLREQRILQELLQQECEKQRQEVWRAEQELLQLKQRVVLDEKENEDEDLEEIEEEMNRNADAKKPGAHRTYYGGFVLSVGFALVMILLGISPGVYSGISYTKPIFWVLEIALGIAGIASAGVAFSGKKKHSKSVENVSENESLSTATAVHDSYVDAAIAQAEKMLFHLKDTLLEKETRLYNVEEQLQEDENGIGYGGKYRERSLELAREQEALELAASEIERLSREYYEDVEDALNAQISSTVSAVTGGVYDSIRVDAGGSLCIQTEGREVAPEVLSRGTLEQIYLALRIAVGNVVMPDEAMPLMLDEAFTMYDDKRLAETLRYLAGLNQQILIFTCQRREIKLLEKLGITYHRVDLE